MKNFEKYPKVLDKSGVDAILLTSRANRLYCAQYDVAEGMALLCKDECYYFTDSRYLEAAEAHLPDFTLVEVKRGYAYPNAIIDVLKKHNLQTVGFEEENFSYADFLKFSSALPAKLVPCQKEVNALRESKEPWELSFLRKAQEITDKTFADLLNIIRIGMTEKELETELIYRLARNGAEGLSFDPIVVSGPNTSLPHGVAGERKIACGDFITMDFGCRYHGYCSDMTRTVAVGFVTEEMDQVYRTVLRAQETALSATKAGITGKDLDGAARKVIADAGYGDYFGHSYGHSLGIEIHEAPNASPSNDQPLPAGAVLSAEPGIYLPGKFGVRIEDVTAFGENGCEILTASPKNLIIL